MKKSKEMTGHFETDMAASIWFDSKENPPPKDGTWLLGMFSSQPFVVQWVDARWLTGGNIYFNEFLARWAYLYY